MSDDPFTIPGYGPLKFGIGKQHVAVTIGEELCSLITGHGLKVDRAKRAEFCLAPAVRVTKFGGRCSQHTLGFGLDGEYEIKKATGNLYVIDEIGETIVYHNPHQGTYWWECHAPHAKRKSGRSQTHPKPAVGGMWRHWNKEHRS